METKPEVAHTVTQHNDAPDSIELTKNSKGYTWNVKVYGDSTKNQTDLVNRAFIMEADIRAKVKILENQGQNITLEPVKPVENQ